MSLVLKADHLRVGYTQHSNTTQYYRWTQVKGTHLESFTLQDGLELHQQIQCRIRGQVLFE